MAARDARARLDREVREAIARMENLAAQERDGGSEFRATPFDELTRRFPGLEEAAPFLSVNGQGFTLREAADAGFVFVRGDGKVVVQTQKTVSTGALSVLSLAAKGRRRK
jgi:hypothetical protein